jgi:streptomycin adenylyltransferase
VKGGNKWARRYGRLEPFQERITEREFSGLCGEFWSHFVWATKKVLRGEFLAAQRALHEVLLEKTLCLLAEEELSQGHRAGPRGRRAEAWLSVERLEAIKFTSHPSRDSLLTTFGRLLILFSDVSNNLAETHQWQTDNYSEVQNWIALQCCKAN